MNTKQNIPLFKPFIPKESIKLVDKTLHTTWVGGDGPKVKELEEKLGQLIGNPYIIALNSGTSALHLALRESNVAGGEVISTPMTCVATNVPIVNEGARIVWADINAETGGIDPADIERKITKRTRAIVAVDWGGFPCDYSAISKIAKQYKIPVIQDAAQSIGSVYKGDPIGTQSDFTAFSTQAIKIINTIDGGFLAFRKKSHYEHSKLLRWYGIDRDKRVYGDTFWDYPIEDAGFKMQMTDVSASIGLGQLPHLTKLVKNRRKIAAIYEKAISKSKSLRFQKAYKGAEPNYWMFTVLCENPAERTKLWKKLKEINVDSGEAHIRNDLYPVFKEFRKNQLPGVESFNDQKLVIPNGFWVSMADAKNIADVLSSF